MAQQNKSMIYGRHPVMEALKSGQAFDKILFQQGVRGPLEKEVRELGRRFRVPVQVIPKERMNKIVSGNHQGIIGFLSLISYYRLDDVLPMVYEQSETPLFLVLDGITDVRNIGAIARSAACCGVHALIIPKKGSAPISAEAIKSSAGALTKLPVCRESSLQNALGTLKLSGVQIFASSLRASKKLYELDLTVPAAIIIGSEGKGVHPSLLKIADETFIIPQKSEMDSFNASVAAGIILYESIKQRGL